jgi:hypothetical protein
MKNKSMALAVIAVLLVSFGVAPPAEAIVALVPAAAVYATLAIMGVITIGAATDNKPDGNEMAVQDRGDPQTATNVAPDKSLDEGSSQLAAIDERTTR